MNIRTARSPTSGEKSEKRDVGGVEVRGLAIMIKVVVVASSKCGFHHINIHLIESVICNVGSPSIGQN